MFKALDLHKIYAFFENVIGLRACETARRTLSKKSATLRLERDGKSVLVQGIDCYFNDGMDGSGRLQSNRETFSAYREMMNV